MTWLFGILGFIIGALTGAALYKQFRSDTVRISELEEQLARLRHQHDQYQQKVHGHFNTSAELIDKMTDSYREVYKHMALSAQDLCPENIANQLSLSRENRHLLEKTDPNQPELFPDGMPPRDYATKASPDAKGNLAEDYGLSKHKSTQTDS